MGEVSYKGHRYPAEIIAHCVWLYHRLPLSFREVEELMLVRGVIVTYETIRQWCAKFGPVYAAGLRRRQPRPGDKWHLDEVFLTINGRRHYLWRAVDQDGNVLDILVQPRRDAKAAKRFFRKLLTKQCRVPRVLVTDKLRSEQFRDLARDLSAALERRGAQLFDAVVVDRIEAGGRWHCVDNCGVAGVLDDPATSAAAAAAVAAGHRMYRTREELKASVAVDLERAAGLAPLLAGAGGAVECVAVSAREAVAAVRRVGEGAVLSDAELAGAAATLVDVRVRDALFTMADSDEAAAAEALWSQLARVLPEPFRAEALVLLGVSAYLRGEGPLVGVALEAALAADPTHRMAGLLDHALQNGVRPEEIRGLLAGLPPAVSV